MLIISTDHEVFKSDFIANWGRIAAFRKPTIAAVSGFAVSAVLSCVVPTYEDGWICSPSITGKVDNFLGRIVHEFVQLLRYSFAFPSLFRILI